MIIVMEKIIGISLDTQVAAFRQGIIRGVMGPQLTKVNLQVHVVRMSALEKPGH